MNLNTVFRRKNPIMICQSDFLHNTSHRISLCNFSIQPHNLQLNQTISFRKTSNLDLKSPCKREFPTTSLGNLFQQFITLLFITHPFSSLSCSSFNFEPFDLVMSLSCGLKKPSKFLVCSFLVSTPTPQLKLLLKLLCKINRLSSLKLIAWYEHN